MNIKIFTMLFLGAIVFFVPYLQVMALKLAPFPGDNSPLQPLPVDVRPNVSGNINAHVDSKQELLGNDVAISELEVDSQQENLTQNFMQNENKKTGKNNTLTFVVIGIGILITTVALILLSVFSN